MRNYKWILFGGSIMFLAALISLFLDHPLYLSAGSEVCNGNCSITETTVNDFVKGAFNYTGIRNISDGEVQLLPVGLTSPWYTDTFSLPGPRAELAAVIYRDPNYRETIYAIGGYDAAGDPQPDIFTATTTITGAIAAPGWSVVTQSPLSVPLAATQAVISTTFDSNGNPSGGFLYVLGGIDTSTFPVSTILYKQLNPNGTLPPGDWSTAALPLALSSHQAFVRNGYLYVVAGGDSYGNLTSDIYRAQILSDGSLGAWMMEGAHSWITRGAFGLAVWNSENSGDWLYLIGGREVNTDFAGQAEVDYTNFEGIALHDPFTNTSSGTVTALPVPRYGHTVVQAGGVLYTIAGDEGDAGNHGITNTVLTGLIDSTPGSVGQLVFPWITTNPLGEGRRNHASVISSIGEIYVIGGRAPDNTKKATVYHGSTSGTGYNFAPAGNYTSRIIDRANNRENIDVKVNAILTRMTGMMLTMQYRAANDQVALLGKTWETLGNMPTGTSTTGVTQTFTLQPADRTMSLLQYRALFTTAYTDTSPILNSFQINYPAPPTPTPTATTTGTVPTLTPTATATTVISPDLTILGIAAPAGIVSASYQTMTIRVANIGNKAFSPIRIPTLAVQPPRSQPPVARPRPSVQIRSSRAPNAYFAWIDLYIDPDPSILPLHVTDLGNCQLPPWQTSQPYVYVGDLPVGTYRDYNVPCLLTTGSHTFYAQVDTCDNSSLNPDYNNTCSTTIGYVIESDETNNIWGPVTSGSIITRTLNNEYLPFIKKNQ